MYNLFGLPIKMFTINPNDFDKNFSEVKTTKKVLITIDDGFKSFYEHAWPYLKENKIPFILFISTEAVGKNGYMNWSQIKEIESESFAFIGKNETIYLKHIEEIIKNKKTRAEILIEQYNKTKNLNFLVNHDENFSYSGF